MSNKGAKARQMVSLGDVWPWTIPKSPLLPLTHQELQANLPTQQLVVIWAAITTTGWEFLNSGKKKAIIFDNSHLRWPSFHLFREISCGFYRDWRSSCRWGSARKGVRLLTLGWFCFQGDVSEQWEGNSLHSFHCFPPVDAFGIRENCGERMATPF